MTAYIMAMPTKTSAGTVEKFTNDAGKEIQKFEIEINGERLIDRTVRLLKDGIDAGDQIVIGGYEKIEGCENYITEAKGFEAHILDAVKHNHGDVLILYGDCYYTEAFINFVLDYQPMDWCHFCRMSYNPYTWKPWGEGYGFKICDKDGFIEKTETWLELVRLGLVNNGNKWNWNRFMNDVSDIYTHIESKPSPHDVVWTKDETDDFDYPRDVRLFKERMAVNFGR
jgi:hypothetical protein